MRLKAEGLKNGVYYGIDVETKELGAPKKSTVRLSGVWLTASVKKIMKSESSTEEKGPQSDVIQGKQYSFVLLNYSSSER